MTLACTIIVMQQEPS